MDRLKSILSEELNKLTAERDGYRAKSLQYKTAAEKVDKQVNRLQHFLSDYETQDIDLSDTPKPAVKPRNGKTWVQGAQDAVMEVLKTAYPQWITMRQISDILVQDGRTGKSVSSCLGRLMDRRIIEKQTMANGRSVTFRLVMAGSRLDAVDRKVAVQ